MRIAISSLAMLGLVSPDEVISQVVDRLIAHEDGRVRMTGTAVLAEMGPSASMAVPKLSQLLDEGDTEVYADALRALRAMGRDALAAAPAVLRLLSRDNQFTVARAKEVLLAIGPDVRPLLESSRGGAPGGQQQHIDELLKRIGVANARGNVEAGEFAWVKDDALIELFVAVGEIWEKEGPTSYRKLSRRLQELNSLGHFKRKIDDSDRYIAKRILRLEALLSGEKVGRFG